MNPESIEEGWFGINIHRAKDEAFTVHVNGWSHGCQVFADDNEFEEFMDIVETPEIETANDLFVLAFKDAVVKLNTLKTNKGTINWGKAKATYIGHLLQALPAFSRFDLPIGGYSGIVNATSKNHGPSWRMIVEMSSPPKAIGIYPGGQSGNPGSNYYDNFIDKWAAGEYNELHFLQDEQTTEDVISTQTLSPNP